jgi:hypothetical protein
MTAVVSLAPPVSGEPAVKRSTRVAAMATEVTFTTTQDLDRLPRNHVTPVIGAVGHAQIRRWSGIPVCTRLKRALKAAHAVEGAAGTHAKSCIRQELRQVSPSGFEPLTFGSGVAPSSYQRKTSTTLKHPENTRRIAVSQSLAEELINRQLWSVGRGVFAWFSVRTR